MHSAQRRRKRTHQRVLDIERALVTRTIWSSKRKQCEIHLVRDQRGWDRWQHGDRLVMKLNN